MRAWTLHLFFAGKFFEHPPEDSPRLAQFDKALARRRAKNKVARASRRANR
jgi:hypothetical protein